MNLQLTSLIANPELCLPFLESIHVSYIKYLLVGPDEKHVSMFIVKTIHVMSDRMLQAIAPIIENWLYIVMHVELDHLFRIVSHIPPDKRTPSLCHSLSMRSNIPLEILTSFPFMIIPRVAIYRPQIGEFYEIFLYDIDDWFIASMYIPLTHVDIEYVDFYGVSFRSDLDADFVFEYKEKLILSFVVNNVDINSLQDIFIKNPYISTYLLDREFVPECFFEKELDLVRLARRPQLKRFYEVFSDRIDWNVASISIPIEFIEDSNLQKINFISMSLRTDLESEDLYRYRSDLQWDILSENFFSDNQERVEPWMIPYLNFRLFDGMEEELYDKIKDHVDPDTLGYDLFCSRLYD